MKRRQELKRVLIVEDDPIIALGIEMALLDAGHVQVTTATAASIALEQLSGVAPHLMVLDLSLGDSDEGFGLAEIALQLFNPPPRIFFSTGSPERIPPHIARLGEVFTKPYDPADLARRALADA